MKTIVLYSVVYTQPEASCSSNRPISKQRHADGVSLAIYISDES